MEKNLSLIIIFLLSLAGMGLWLYEIVVIKTWYGLNWLKGQLYSPFVAALFSVFAFITPFLIKKQLNLKKTVICIIIFYATNIICFYIGKYLSYESYNRFLWSAGRTLTYINIMLLPLIVVGLYVFLGFVYRLTTHKLIKKNKTINTLYITLLLLLTIPLSLLTIRIHPGFGSGTGWIDAVKMGYPIFWTTMLLGLSGQIIAKQPDLITTDKLVITNK